MIARILKRKYAGNFDEKKGRVKEKRKGKKIKDDRRYYTKKGGREMFEWRRRGDGK